MGNEGNEAAFELGFRPGTPADLPFVADSWRRSYDSSQFARCPGGLREYVTTQQQVIMQCLGTSKVLVAYPKAPESVPDQILGWLCYRMGNAEPPIVQMVAHFVYVKAPFRRKGIAHALFNDVAMSHCSMVELYATHFLPRQYRGGWFDRIRLHYNPALIYGGTP